jgi:putative flippase GtrA
MLWSIRRVWTDERARYIVVAGGSTVLLLGFYAAGLRMGIPYLAANALAQVVVISLAFPVYRALVFRSRGGVRKDFARFVSVWSGGMVGGWALTPVLVEGLGLAPFLGLTVSVILISTGSYLSHRWFTFSSKVSQSNG